MPLYEYRCRSCDHQFEVQQSFSDDPLTVCPECEGALRKVFNPVGISFKGSGFYKNDSRGSTSSGTGASSDAGSSGSGTSDSSSTDSSSSTSGSGSGGDGGSSTKQPASTGSSGSD